MKLIRCFRYPIMAILFLWSVVLTNSSHAAGLVFYDDFESYSVGKLTTNKWSTSDWWALPQVVSSALDKGAGPTSGSKMLRTNWNGLVAWNDPNAQEICQLDSFPYTTEFLIRFKLRTDRDVDTVRGSKVFRLTLDSGSKQINRYYFSMQMEKSGGPIFSNLEYVDGAAQNYNAYGSIPLGDGSWHKVEIYVKQDPSGGAIFRLWLDGKLQHERTGFTSNPSNPWRSLILNSNWSNNPGWQHDANNHVYWDDIEIFSDKGTGASGSMANATISAGNAAPLPPPTNLRIQP